MARRRFGCTRVALHRGPMARPRARRLAASAAALLLSLPIPGPAQPPVDAAACTGFKWDVTRERALFAAPAAPLAAANDGRAPPAVATNRLYQLRLAPAGEMRFPAPPGKAPADGTFAGVARLLVPGSGRYRIALDAPLWIDVVAGDRRVPANDYEGQPSCDAPRKIVEFDLDGSQRLTLQLSGAAQAIVRIAVVAVPRGS